MKSLTPILLIIVSIGVFLFYIDPEYKKVKQLQGEIVENDRILEVANRLKKKKDELTDKYNQISDPEREQLEKLLPNSVDNIRLLIDIKNIALEKAIVIRDVKIDSREFNEGESKKVVSSKSNFDGIMEDNGIKYVDTSKIGVISFSFTVSAKYEVFLDFLRKLEESLRLVDIRKIEITRGAGSTFYNYNVTLDTYWLK